MNDTDNNKPIVWYVADPMCSWCWGFSPVVERLKQHYRDNIQFALILGGLRPYTQQPVTDESRREILQHWHEVHRMTGQEFNFDEAMTGSFVYDTEPASRAVVVVGEMLSDRTFEYFKAVQQAFYVRHQDITQEPVLWELLRALLGEAADSKEAEFKRRFESQEARQKTQAHFHKSRQLGVRGFPTLILQDEQHYYLLNSGYRPYAELALEIDTYLQTQHRTVH